MKVLRGRGSGVSLALATALYCAACSVAGAAPDLSGTYWATTYSPKIRFSAVATRRLMPRARRPMRRTRRDLRTAPSSTRHGMSACRTAMPRVLATPYPFEVFQLPVDHVTFIFEMNHQNRVWSWTGRCHRRTASSESREYNGHSVGHWDGDTLVVEVDRLPVTDLPRCQRPAAQRGHDDRRTHSQGSAISLKT